MVADDELDDTMALLDWSWMATWHRRCDSVVDTVSSLFWNQVVLNIVYRI